MNEGYILLHRKMLENAIFYKPDYYQIWCYILLKVNHKDNEFIWNNEKKIVKKGSGIFSQKKISEELKISIGTVHNCLKYLKSESQIEIKTTPRFTEIQVLKWEEYQSVESIIENRMKTERKRSETNKHDKQDKQERGFVPPSEIEVINYFKEKGYSVDKAKRAFEYYATASWKDSKGNKVKNWKQKMISVWFKDEFNKGTQKSNAQGGSIV